nr:tetraacyldisaccharide 4'-kinase [uncultured Desulfuromonas sp.]
MAFFLDCHRRLVQQGAPSWPDRLLFAFLWPFSLLYGAINALRIWCYHRGWLTSYHSSLFVISVGNLAVGGLGKTPVVDWLVKTLSNQGKRVAVVSRGYGGQFSGEVAIVSSGKGGVEMDAQTAGDEPVLLARRNPQVPVLIARKRAHALKSLEQSFDVDVVILDDAFQHRQVARQVDLVLLDATRPFGNGWPLPLGNLREFPQALRRADLLLLTRCQGEAPTSLAGKPTFTSRHLLSRTVTDLSGCSLSVDQLMGKRIVAFAGIANPDSFFSALSELGLPLSDQLSFADHVVYSDENIARVERAAEQADVLITTEKDAVKLNANMFKIPCYQIPLTIEIENSASFTRYFCSLI